MTALDERLVTGQMDRCISEMMTVTKRATTDARGLGAYDEITLQTLKHHAEDMILAGQAMLKMIGRTDEQITEVLNQGNSE